MARAKQIWMAFRTPILLGFGLALFVKSDALFRNLILLQRSHNPFHAFFCSAPFQHDCFMFLPISFFWVTNTVRLFIYLIFLFVFLEASGLFLSHQGRPRWSRWTVGLTFVLAAVPWFVLLRIEGPLVRLLPLFAVYTAMVWLFIVVNSGWKTVEGFFARHRWTTGLMEWTFPVSDLFLFKLHRQRMGPGAGWLRRVSVAFVLVILIALLRGEWSLLQGSIRAERLPVEVYDPYAVLVDQEGFWYSDTVATTAGLWRYDEGKGKAMPFLRAQELRSFSLQDGFFYLHDLFMGGLLKVDAKTRQVIWRVPLPAGRGPYELKASQGLIFSIGRGGYLAVVESNGHKRFERTLPFAAWYPQVLGQDRVALVSPNSPVVRIIRSNPAEDEVIPLPLSGRIVRPESTSAENAIPLITGTEYVGESKILYVATLWGEIFRYDLALRQWLTSFHVCPGILLLASDSKRGLLFVHNSVRGTVEAIELESGSNRATVIAHGFGNRLTVVPEIHVAIVSSHGAAATSLPKRGGLYRFDYSNF